MGELTTNYSYPFALIKSGGEVKGHRPRTKFAFIRKAVAVDGNIVTYRCRVRIGQRWSKSDYDCTPEKLIKTWRHWPSEKMLKAAKRRLRKVE